MTNWADDRARAVWLAETLIAYRKHVAEGVGFSPDRIPEGDIPEWAKMLGRADRAGGWGAVLPWVAGAALIWMLLNSDAPRKRSGKAVTDKYGDSKWVWD